METTTEVNKDESLELQRQMVLYLSCENERLKTELAFSNRQLRRNKAVGSLLHLLLLLAVALAVVT